MHVFTMGIMEGELLQSGKSKPTSPFGNLIIENVL